MERELALILFIPSSLHPLMQYRKPEVEELLNRVAGAPKWDLMENPSVILKWSEELRVVMMRSVLAPYLSIAFDDNLAFGLVSRRDFR